MNLTYKALTSDQETEVQRVPNARQTATVFGGQPENKQPIPVGPIGPQGPKGDKGDTGATGPQGLKGDPGPQGDQGSSGPVGPAGPIGGPGPKGDKGDTGATGPQGPVGAQGSTGPQGPIGLTGPQGPKGDKGDKGDIGNTGPTGPPGPVPEAPLDGTVYGRKNATWSPVAATGNATTVDDTPPATPKYGDRWIKPSNGSEMVWVPNAGTPGVWLNPVDAAMANAITYPITINKGGTGATTAPAALLNLGVTNAGGQWILPDGTVAAPGLAWASEPGLGLYRLPTSVLVTAAQGKITSYIDASTATVTSLGMSPRAAGSSKIALSNQPNGTPNANFLEIMQNANGDASITPNWSGSATQGKLILNAPQVLHNDGTVAAPNIAFASEPGLGWYRNGASVIRLAAQGAAAFELDSSNAAATFASFFPRSATGAAELDLYSRPATSAGAQSWLGLKMTVSGAATISTGAAGGPTRGNLTLDAPATSVLTSAGEARFSINGDFYAGGDVYPSGVAGTKKFPALVATNAAFPFIQFSSDNWRLQYTAANGTLSYVSFSNAVILNVDGVGNFTISGATATKASGTTWANPSSRSIKHDIEDYPLGIDAILQVRPRTYRLNDAPERVNVGIVADEVEGPFPQSISYDANGMPLFQADPLFWALVNSVKTLHERLSHLELHPA